jgi:hypothetical protein
MGLFGRKKKDLTLDGLPGVAAVVWLEDAYYDMNDDTISPADLGIGNVKRGMHLDVTLDDGRPTYRIEGKQKLPAKHSANLAEGMKIPLYADPNDPQTVDLNWEAFEASGEVDKFFPRDAEHATGMVHDAMDGSRQMMIDGWLKAVEVGGMSAAAFEEAIAGAVTSGMLTEEEGAAARARLG